MCQTSRLMRHCAVCMVICARRDVCARQSQLRPAIHSAQLGACVSGTVAWQAAPAGLPAAAQHCSVGHHPTHRRRRVCFVHTDSSVAGCDSSVATRTEAAATHHSSAAGVTVLVSVDARRPLHSFSSTCCCVRARVQAVPSDHGAVRVQDPIYSKRVACTVVCWVLRLL